MERYSVQRYGRWRWIIVDSATGIAVRKPGMEHITDFAYDGNGTPVFLSYGTAAEADAKCRELNGSASLS